MKQVIVIHGGTTFSSHESYLEYLRIKSVKIERLIYAPTWKDGLQAELTDTYQVLLPKMPNATNAKYDEWKLWFDRISEVVTDNCILVGHSLGAVFLAKYLSENVFAKPIAATILIAAPFNDETTEDLTAFKLEGVSDTFKNQAGRVIFFNGPDDPVIPMTELELYRNELPSADFKILSASDHFVRANFPELTAAIRSI